VRTSKSVTRRRYVVKHNLIKLCLTTYLFLVSHTRNGDDTLPRSKSVPRKYSLLHTLAIWYSLFILGYKPVQHVTVLNTVGNCNTVISIIIYYNIILLCYNLMEPPSYMRSVVMWRILVVTHFALEGKHSRRQTNEQ